MHADMSIENVYQFISREDAIKLLDEIDQSHNQTFLLMKCIIQNNKILSLKCFKRLCNSPIDYSKEDTENSDTIMRLNASFEPETDLWDAILLDYFLLLAIWAKESFIPKIQSITSEQVYINFNAIHKSHGELSSDLGTATGLQNTGHLEASDMLAITLLLGFALLQCLRWWLSKEDKVQADLGCNLVCYMFLMSAFKVEPKSITPNTDINGEMVDFISNSITDNVNELSLQTLTDMLPLSAKQMLIDMLIGHFFRHFRLLETIFAKDLMEKRCEELMPCHLHFTRIPSSYRNVTLPWPPPLGEAVSVGLLLSYRDKFPADLMKNLNLESINAEPPQSTQDQSDASQNRHQYDLETSKKSFLLTNLETFGKDDLRALASLSDGDVLKVLSDVDIFLSKEVPPEVQPNQLEEFAHNLIQDARERLKHMNLITS